MNQDTEGILPWSWRTSDRNGAPRKGQGLNSRTPEIDLSASIDKSAHIEGDVRIGPGTTVGHCAYIRGPAAIGSNSWIGPFVCIGTPGQFADQRYGVENVEQGRGGIIIGNN